MQPATDLISPYRFEAADTRADGARRVVVVDGDAIRIDRRIAGVAMTIRLSARDFLGLSLRLTGARDDAFDYAIVLVHRDPDLSVVLAQSTSQIEIERQWRRWATSLGVRRLVERRAGCDEAADVACGALGLRSARRRGRASAVAKRRPRFLVRRKNGDIRLGAGKIWPRRILGLGAKPER